jgi:hypothetical protein
MDVETMKAGRELDALIAQKIFHYRWLVLGGFRYLESPDSNPFNLEESSDGSEPLFSEPYKFVPAFSTDIQAALLVVEKIRCTDEAPDQVFWRLTDCSDLGWTASIERVVKEGDGDVMVACGKGNTLPLAVCRAALQTARLVADTEDGAGEGRKD